MNNAAYRNTIENLRKRIDLKLVNNEKNYLKCTLKPSYMWHKIFDNSLIRKSNASLKHNKPVYIGMCILKLSKSINVRIPLRLH